jgi:hypothetical protein
MKNLEYPIVVIWSNKDHDISVTLIECYGEYNGMFYYRAETGTGIPENEIIWPKKKFNFWGLFNRK